MEPAEQRISDQERHQVAEVLREAAGEGRIDVDELDKRLESTFCRQDLRGARPDHRRPTESEHRGPPGPAVRCPGSRADP
jgi:hypothetical protein